MLWGINTRVTDILRDEKLLPMFRRAGLIHVSLGTEAAAQLKLDRFNKETTIAQNKKAIQLLRDAGIVTEAQFIVGLENETAETLEETYRMARDWNPDMANWAMYTPWPFSDLFQELGDKVEVFDFEKYNFVTPIMKPDAMDRGELLDRVMNNYRRFFMNKTFFQYPWTKDKTRRKYLMGCLKAFLKSGFERKFYDLGRVGYRGPQSKKSVDFAFDAARTYERPSALALAEADAGWVTMHGPKIEHKRRQGEINAAMACGGGTEQTRARRRRRGVSSHQLHAGRIGPNAITRVAEATRWLIGDQAATDLFDRAGLSSATSRTARAAWSPRRRSRGCTRPCGETVGDAMARRVARSAGRPPATTCLPTASRGRYRRRCSCCRRRSPAGCCSPRSAGMHGRSAGSGDSSQRAQASAVRHRWATTRCAAAHSRPTATHRAATTTRPRSSACFASSCIRARR